MTTEIRDGAMTVEARDETMPAEIGEEAMPTGTSEDAVTGDDRTIIRSSRREIKGRLCRIDRVTTKAGSGEEGPVFLLGGSDREKEQGEAFSRHLLEELILRAPGRSFTVVSYYARDWNRDFSPWQAPPIFGEEAFGGQGTETLQWLTEECIPCLKEEFGKECCFYTAGYSLAGLFSLWALYEKDVFSGGVCCSGSLWFEGWRDYVGERSIKRQGSLIYLSLGGKEAKTKNPRMATIADATREQEKCLKADAKVRQSLLEWNSGGHFADSGQRLAKGMAWIIGKEGLR